MVVPSARSSAITELALAETADSQKVQAWAPRGHGIRHFDYVRDYQDLKEICATVYGGTDYMPRIIQRIASDPGTVILAAEATPSAATQDPQQEAEQNQELRLQDGCIDGIVCGERRGQAVFLYGLRVREGTRGRGLGHLLMGAICNRSARELAAASDAQPPPLLPSASRGAAPGSASAPVAAPTPPTPPDAVRPISHIVTCTTSYNHAAQRIIGRQLAGPLYQVEGWPGHKALDEYEAAVGWVRGSGVPEGASSMLDWLPGARSAVTSDSAAQALLPGWRRVTSNSELRSAVAHMLNVSSSSGGGGGSSSGGGGSSTGGGGSSGGGHDASGGAGPAVTSSRPEIAGLLWLPMPYDVWPLDSVFVQRELAAGNIWLLRSSGADDGGEVIGVMMVTHFETLSRVCAGILARDNSVTHAAIAHATSMHPHFMACTLRNPAGCCRPTPLVGAHLKTTHDGEALDSEPLPALYDATGGFRDFWVYGRTLGPLSV